VIVMLDPAFNSIRASNITSDAVRPCGAMPCATQASAAGRAGTRRVARRPGLRCLREKGVIMPDSASPWPPEAMPGLPTY